MTPPNSLLYTDQRVLLALARLLVERALDEQDQVETPITQTEIAETAIVSLRTVAYALDRLTGHGLVIAERGRGRPLIYTLSPSAWQIVEEHNGQNIHR